jgi:UDP-N-acetylmuramoyl-L-alanyl-D-glutamate--2,6-diaminopimelate ligase
MMDARPLAQLLDELPVGYQAPADLPAISGLTDDSRQVEPGWLFVAVPGGQADGHDYLAQAVERGAVAAVGERELESPVPYVRVANARLALGHLAAGWHGRPARKLVMLGVTGTDGKTTTANLIHRILQQAGLAAGLITTVNAVLGEQVVDTGFHVTTPPAMRVQAYLAQMVAAGQSHCVLEATSHGLAQQRVAACEFDVAVVTNITHEHLDFHGSQQAYRQAKAELFLDLDRSVVKADGPPKTAVLNAEDDSYGFLSSLVEARQIAYGRGGQVTANSVESSPQGLSFMAKMDGEQAHIESRLAGDYNVSNCLAAIAATVGALGIPMQAAVRGIAELDGVPGRMELIRMGQPFAALVDFAHTPNALRRALQAARRMTEGRLIAVFGSAGLRDREKRRLMAEASAELADVTILTAEDPRTESLDAILDEMAQAAVAAGAVEGETLHRQPDRGQALRQAVALAKPADLVIACGKGHEQSMCFGEVEYPWDDRTALRAALAELLGTDGPAMPQLPTSRQHLVGG